MFAPEAWNRIISAKTLQFPSQLAKAYSDGLFERTGLLSIQMGA